ARNVVAVVGDKAGDPEPLVSWCERANWPLIAEPHSNARRGPNALRAADAILRNDGFVAHHRPDLVVVAARIGPSRPVQDWLRQTPHIVVSPDGDNWDVTRSARSVLRSDTDAFAALDEANNGADAEWLSAWRTGAQDIAAAIDDVLDATDHLTEP